MLTTFAGQPALRVRAPDGAEATVLAHGAHLVSWIPAGGEEQIYLSPDARYGAGASIRGGVPVIFPQFSTRGPLPRHGFARTRPWTVTETAVRGAHAIGVLRLTDDEETRAIWPHRFEAELTVVLAGGELELELAVTNLGDTPLAFTAALHTYLRSADARRLQLEGLQGCGYEDALTGENHVQWSDVVTVAGEIDRIYRDVARTLTLRELGRRVEIGIDGFRDVVVWNPGPEQARKLSDLPDDGWLQMLCVEAASIHEPVEVAAGDTWTGRQRLGA